MTKSPSKKKQHQKYWSSTVCGVHAALIVGSPSFAKASVLCHLPNQYKRLKHALIGSKPAGIPKANSVSKMFSFFHIFFIIRSSQNFTHEGSISQMTISKRCDVPSYFLFVHVASVCVYVLGSRFVCFCFED